MSIQLDCIWCHGNGVSKLYYALEYYVLNTFGFDQVGEMEADTFVHLWSVISG